MEEKKEGLNTVHDAFSAWKGLIDWAEKDNPLEKLDNED
jgi:hypothetical protein